MLQFTEFAQPAFLYLLLIIPLMIVWYWFKHNERNADIKLSSTEGFLDNKKTYKQTNTNKLSPYKLELI